jgi:hypothetical protein
LRHETVSWNYCSHYQNAVRLLGRQIKQARLSSFLKTSFDDESADDGNIHREKIHEEIDLIISRVTRNCMRTFHCFFNSRTLRQKSPAQGWA